MKKEVTIYDIARELNISPATVSRGLKSNSLHSKATVKRILEKAEEMGYRHNNFASSLRKQKTHTIGVLVHELNSTFITQVLAGIEKISTHAGYDILIAHSSENIEKEISNVNNLFHRRVDGLIAALSNETKNLDHFQIFFDKQIPVVFFDRVDESSDAPKVIIDNFSCGYHATEHLIQQGCKRIAIITSNLSRNVYSERFRGYKEALDKNGTYFNEDLLFVTNLSEIGAMEVIEKILLMEEKPDGLFVTNDFSAAVCMRVLKENGYNIPKDIAVVGFNNDAISKIIEPQLTTINYPGNDIGEIAVQKLISLLKGKSDPKEPKTIIAKSELIVRESSLKVVS